MLAAAKRGRTREDGLAALVDELLAGGRRRTMPQPVLDALERIELARRGASSGLPGAELTS